MPGSGVKRKDNPEPSSILKEIAVSHSVIEMLFHILRGIMIYHVTNTKTKVIGLTFITESERLQGDIPPFWPRGKPTLDKLSA
jgi:hypothetical protein